MVEATEGVAFRIGVTGANRRVSLRGIPSNPVGFVNVLGQSGGFAMPRELAQSTVQKFGKRLEEERGRLETLIEEARVAMEQARQTESSSERSSDPGNAEAGSMKFEYEKELSMQQNSIDLLRKVEHALSRIDSGDYGICESCGSSIPLARLEALPYATLCVDCASKR